jgi:AcrR family transcriptional regulator
VKPVEGNAEAARTRIRPDACEPGAGGRRRRGEELEHAICDAAVTQLSTCGYGHLTMEGVAAAARTGKASLYRRWTSKEELVLDAMAHVMPDLEDSGSATDSLRGDLLALLGQTESILSGPKGALVRSLLGEVDPGSSLLTAMRVRLIAPRLQHLVEIIERGIERGEARPGSATRTYAEIGPAVLLHRFLLYGRLTRDDVEEVVDEIIVPLLSAAPRP